METKRGQSNLPEVNGPGSPVMSPMAGAQHPVSQLENSSVLFVVEGPACTPGGGLEFRPLSWLLVQDCACVTVSPEEKIIA